MILFFFLFHFGQGLSSQAIPLAGSHSISNNSNLFFRDVSSPCICPNTDQRTVWDILWSCLVVAFACSWVSVHPDIPAPRESWRRTTLRRLEYMLWTVLTPELIILWAGKQFLGARGLAKEYRDHHWTATHGHFLQMGGFMLFDGKNAKGVLSHIEFAQLLREGRIEFPEITEEDIKDRGKSDGLGKTLVIAQTGWFILQCISRRAQGLDITEIELATLAFAALNGLMYVFWWNKPFDVQVSVPVRLIPPPTTDKELPVTALTQPHPPDPSNDDAESELSSKMPSVSPRRSQNWLRTICYGPSYFVKFMVRRLQGVFYFDSEEFGDFEAHDAARATDEEPRYVRVPTFYAAVGDVDKDHPIMILALGQPLIASIFGTIHCAGWSFHFPSTAERWIWRVSSLLITILPPTALLLGLMSLYFTYNVDRGGRTSQVLDLIYFFVLKYIFFPVYFAARIVLLGVAFTALRDLPPGALAVVKWTSFIPHVS